MYYLSIFVVVLAWLFLPFSAKSLSNNMSTKDIFIYTKYGLLIGIVILLLTAKYLKYEIEKPLNEIDYKSMIIMFFRAVLALAMPFFIIYLMGNYQATQVLAQIRPIVIALTVLLGVCIYNEKVTHRDYFAIFLIISGVVLLNYNNSINIKN
mgnify:CR=1 FL=1|tara:strand:+ start:3035 stop:3490 length:456 start_codon:yes stop_codon:yes gene_type:complete